MGSFMFYAGPVEDAFAVNLNVNAVQDDGTPIESTGPGLKKAYAGAVTAYKAVDEGFVTIDGKKSYWLSSKFTTGSNNVHVQNLQYLIVGGNHKAYTITFTALESNFAKYRPLFESTAMTAVTD
jgi:hypothetical protein